MGAKGQNDCCCGGCFEPPWNLSLALRAVQPMQQLCCSCIPKHVCVSYICPGNSVTAPGEVSYQCGQDYNDKESRYVVNIPNVDDDFTFYFEIDEYNQCWFKLESDYFYEQPDPIEVDRYFRDIFCPRCKPCLDEFIEFDVNTPDCADAKVRISPASLTSIPPLPRCCDCPDPCEDVEYPEATTCGCGGCGCIADSACLVVVTNDTVTTMTAAMCNFRWDFANGMSVKLSREPDGGCCQLELDTGNIVPDIEPGGIGVNKDTNPCPYPVAEWNFKDTAKTPPDDDVTVHFMSVVCGECGAIGVSGCCDGVIPRVLTATVEGGEYCCGTVEVILIYDALAGQWIGTNSDGWCGGEITIRLGCDPSEWVIEFEASECVTKTDGNAGVDDCEPVNLSFSITTEDINPVVGPFCCGQEGDTVVTITVTE